MREANVVKLELDIPYAWLAVGLYCGDRSVRGESKADPRRALGAFPHPRELTILEILPVSWNRREPPTLVAAVKTEPAIGEIRIHQV